MIDYVIATVLSAIISSLAIWWQQPSSEVSGILNIMVVFTLTFTLYFAANISMYSERTKEVQEILSSSARSIGGRDRAS